MKTSHRIVLALAGLLGCLAAPAAFADISVGYTLSLTGPGASLGIPAKNAVALMPKSVGGEKINYVVYDDASDSTNSLKNVRKLIAENNVDVLVGSSTTPATLALVDAVSQAGTPLVSMAASSAIVLPMDDKRRWIFKPIQNESLMMAATVKHMKQKGIKTIGYLGFSDSYGDAWLHALQQAADAAGMKVVAVEKYSRGDTSVTAQALKIVAARPDAVFLATSGTPAALPLRALRERGFHGLTYQTYGVATAEFLRVAGKDADGSFFAVAPVMVVDELPDSAPMKRNAVEFTRNYEAAYGQGSRSIFASNAWDGSLLLNNALERALKVAKPGTPEFRAALRDALEGTSNLVSTQGVFNMTPQDHVGYDERAAVMVQIQDGAWHLQK